MISFHHSFSTRIFLNEASSPERDARRAAAATAVARAREEAQTPNELREFWWFLRSAKGEQWRRDDPSREARAAKSISRGTGGPASNNLTRGGHA